MQAMNDPVGALEHVHGEVVPGRPPWSKWRLAVVALGALAVAFSASGTAQAADPVVSAIWKAQRAGQIDRERSQEYQRIWRASASTARSLTRRKHAGRAREVLAARDIAIGIGKRGELSAERLPGVLASVKATSYVMRRDTFPTYEQRIRVPNDPLVYVYFTGRGVQFHPLATFAWANTLYATGQDAELKRLADRLLEIKVTRGTFTTWEYSFPYEHGRAPWISGMAQAVGAQVFARVWERTDEAFYREVAKSAVSAFTVPATDGGVMAYEGSGRWYVLYGYNAQQRVLNGHLQALLSLNEYYKITKDEDARLRFDEGVAAVLPLLARFDTGAWSMYDLTHEADLNYHDLMTTQLSRLGSRKQIAAFSDLAHRFATYRTTPPVITAPPQTLLPILPRKDGRRDRTKVRFHVDKRARVTVRIVSSVGRTVRTITAHGPRGKRAVWWDGRSDAGRIVAPGAYTVAITATDLVGNRREGNVTEPLRVEADAKPRRRATRR